MKYVPDAINRKVAGLAVRGQKHSPTILLGAGIVSMVGSTVLACRATLKLEEVIDKAQNDLEAAKGIRELHPEEYSDQDRKKDTAIIYMRGLNNVVRLYGPSVLLGGVGVVCLTKSHSILKERNAALAAAYMAVDKAFTNYRERVVDRYGEEVDRELRYEGSEEVDIVDAETGKIISSTRVTSGDKGMYARWFDEENRNWQGRLNEEWNWIWLRQQQNFLNDMLHARGHVFLNEAYACLGMEHTSAGSVVGWVFDRNNDRGDNYIDFGCWGEENEPLDWVNGREGILLDFNVDGPIWELIDVMREKRK